MTKRITNKTVKEWKEKSLHTSVPQLAREYGVANTTIYYHLNKKQAANRRAQWRAVAARRREERAT